jgi:hypothetical protein
VTSALVIERVNIRVARQEFFVALCLAKAVNKFGSFSVERKAIVVIFSCCVSDVIFVCHFLASCLCCDGVILAAKKYISIGINPYGLFVFKSDNLGMNPNILEHHHANGTWLYAMKCASPASEPGDWQAATVAILLTALELATPNLTAQQRADLINQPEEN